MRFSKKISRVHVKLLACVNPHLHSRMYTKRHADRLMTTSTITQTPYVASLISTHTHIRKIRPLKSLWVFLKFLFQPPILSGGCLFSFNYLLLFFPQDHEIKIYTWIPRALVIRFHIFYSEIKQQGNEHWNLTPCCSGRAKVREINFAHSCRGKTERRRGKRRVAERL